MFLNYSTFFEGQTAHHQELKTVIAASGLTYVCGCRLTAMTATSYLKTFGKRQDTENNFLVYGLDGDGLDQAMEAKVERRTNL